MFQSLRANTKTRREYLTKLFEAINSSITGYGGAVVSSLPHPNQDSLHISLVKETMDLKRFLRLPHASQYLWSNRHSQDGGQITPLTDVPAELAGSSVLFQTTEPKTQKLTVRFRKGEKNDKDLFIEVWTPRGFVSSRKVSDKVTKIYNDSVFGSATWSADQSKIIFVGEKPESASYKNYWEDAS